jgi:aspartate-semialdehyde dehydrogenase
VNGALLDARPRIVANPNCVAAIMTVALAPLAGLAHITRINAATYQAASGAGLPAMRELEESTRAYLDGRPFEPRVLPHPYAFNFFSHNTPIDPETGYNGEETKVIKEVRRIMDRADLRVSATCIRVPVLRAHGIAMSVEFDAVVTPAAARAALAAAPGLRLVDDSGANRFPMPIEASGADDVLVGRIRTDLSDPDGRTIALFVCGDQLLKGAALNAVQIAERLAG